MKEQNPIEAYRKAVALRYDGQHAPNVTATAEGDRAEQVIALARKHGIPLYENSELVAMLSLLELGDEIPHELYVIIAQIIALAYNIKAPDQSPL